jgi:hypothetical protein
MTQEYTPVAWQDETTSQQGTLINAERLNQMQTAHHYADGLEEVDAIPTADPGVSYHKIVYCTADSTIYRWDGTEWTKDIDDETKALLQQEIARATEAEGELAQSIEDEATARETADSAMQADISDLGDAIEAEETARGQADTALGTRITNETSARETADTELGADIGAETARARQAEQANAQAIATHVADKQNPHEVTKAQVGLGNVDNTADLDKPVSTATQTALNDKASTTAVQAVTARVDTLESAVADRYTKAETDTLLAAKADSTALTAKLDTLSTTGLHAYTHNGATQNEVAVIDGTTASTIPIRDTNGRMQAADPASGVTDKTLTTANWVSQTGDNAPNNLVHKYGAETIHDDKSFTNPIKTKYFLCNRFSITPQNNQYWVKVYTYNNASRFAVPSFAFTAVTREHSDLITGTVQLNLLGGTVQKITLKGLATDTNLKQLFAVTSESADEFTLWYNCDWYTGGLRANVTFSLASNYAVDNVTSINPTGAAQQAYDISETGYTDENGITHTFLAYAVMS